MADIKVHIQLNAENLNKVSVNDLCIDYQLSSVNGERAYKFGIISCEIDESLLHKVEADRRVHKVVVDDGTELVIVDGSKNTTE
jgi:hypothetical protein